MNGYASKDEFLKQTLIEHLLGGLWNPRSPLWERGTLYLFGSLLPNKRNRPYWVCFLLFRLRDGTVPLHDLRRREWAWVDGEASATREKTRSIGHELCQVPETTMFLTGPTNPTSATKYTLEIVWFRVFFFVFEAKMRDRPLLCRIIAHSFTTVLWILHLNLQYYCAHRTIARWQIQSFTIAHLLNMILGKTMKMEGKTDKHSFWQGSP